MKLVVRRKSGIPIYVQIKSEIARMLGENELLPSERLPTERELSEQLGVSRNTVSQAYRELEQEGLVVSRVGHGTFVADQVTPHRSRSREEVLHRHIRHAVEEALALGFQIGELQTAFHDYLEGRQKLIERVRIVFIECNDEQATYFGQHLDLDPHVEVIPLILDKLREGDPDTIKEIKKGDIIVTSFYHLTEIRKLVPGRRRHVVAVSLDPDVSTIIRIARLSPSSTLGIVTTSKQFQKEIVAALKEKGLEFDNVVSSVKGDGKDVSSVIEQADAIIVSPGRKPEMEKLVGRQPLIEFVFVPDQTSINNLKITILEHMEKANS